MSSTPELNDGARWFAQGALRKGLPRLAVEAVFTGIAYAVSPQLWTAFTMGTDYRLKNTNLKLYDLLAGYVLSKGILTMMTGQARYYAPRIITDPGDLRIASLPKPGQRFTLTLKSTARANEVTCMGESGDLMRGVSSDNVVRTLFFSDRLGVVYRVDFHRAEEERYKLDSNVEGFVLSSIQPPLTDIERLLYRETADILPMNRSPPLLQGVLRRITPGTRIAFDNRSFADLDDEEKVQVRGMVEKFHEVKRDLRAAALRANFSFISVVAEVLMLAVPVMFAGFTWYAELLIRYVAGDTPPEEELHRKDLPYAAAATFIFVQATAWVLQQMVFGTGAPVGASASPKGLLTATYFMFTVATTDGRPGADRRFLRNLNAQRGKMVRLVSRLYRFNPESIPEDEEPRFRAFFEGYSTSQFREGAIADGYDSALVEFFQSGGESAALHVSQAPVRLPEGKHFTLIRRSPDLRALPLGVPAMYSGRTSRLGEPYIEFQWMVRGVADGDKTPLRLVRHRAAKLERILREEDGRDPMFYIAASPARLFFTMEQSDTEPGGEVVYFAFVKGGEQATSGVYARAGGTADGFVSYFIANEANRGDLPEHVEDDDTEADVKAYEDDPEADTSWKFIYFGTHPYEEEDLRIDEETAAR